MQFQLGDCTFQAQQEPAVDRARIVNAVAVGDQAVGVAAEIEQLIPVGAVARQPRRFVGHNQADLSQRHLGGELLKAEPANGGGGGAPGIVIDDEHVLLLPAKLTGTPRHGILQPLALGVGHYLVRARLPDIDHGASCQVSGLNQIGNGHRTSPEKCGLVLQRLVACLRPGASPRLGRRGSLGLRTQLVLLYEGQEFLHSGAREFVLGSVVPQAQKTGGGTRQTQHDAIAIANQNMAVGGPCQSEDFKLPPIERMGGIGHFQPIAAVVRVVERGINIGYRSTASRTPS